MASPPGYKRPSTERTKQIYRISLCGWICLWQLLLSHAATAETSDIMRVKAISLHGSPKYTQAAARATYGNPQASKGGILVLPGTGSFDTLNPYVLKGMSPINTPGMGQYGISELNEPLMAGTGFHLQSPDEPQSAYCLICEYVEFPEDYRWVTFAINPAARFHNGDPIVADDIISSFKLLTSDKADPRYQDIYSPVAKLEKLDQRKVRFYLQEPNLKTMVFRLGELPVMSHRFWAKHDFGASGSIPQPLSGPYKITQVDMGKRIVLSKVPDHWAHDHWLYRGLFNFDEVRMEFFRDRTVAFEAFKAGQLDVFYEYVAKNWANAYDFPAIRSGAIIREEIKHQIPGRYQAFFMNGRRELFKDSRVRQALTLLFDFEWTNKNIFASAYRRTNSYFPNSTLGAVGLPSAAELELLQPFRKQLPPEVFTRRFQLPETRGNGNMRTQLRQALQLLQAAGWQIQRGKLINKSTHQAFQFEILIDQASFARVLSPYVNNLRKAGIQVEIRRLDTAQYKARLDQFDFDMISYVIPQGLSPSHEQRLYFHSDLAATKGSRNFSGIENPAVDALLDKIIQADNRQKLTTATRALDRVLSWNYYSIPHWHIDYHRIAYKNKLRRPQPLPALHLGFPYWWIDK